MQEHRVLIVAGENADERVKEFSANAQVEPYIKYYYADAAKLKEQKIEMFSELVKNQEIKIPRAYVEDELKWLKETSDEDFYFDLTAEYECDDDGNAITTENPGGRYASINHGGSFSQPFILKDGRDVYAATKGEIDWNAIHRNPEMTNLYERTWEMCMEGLKPVSDIDKQVYENMKNRQEYFSNFKDKEEYVASCTSFWAHAFLSPFDVWMDVDDYPGTQFEWMSSYYDMFIAPLPGNTRLTIFEYITK